MPVATPAQYGAMIDAAQEGGYAFPAINVTSIVTINAALNDRNFWDGRAERFFNGVNPFGKTDPNARVWKKVGIFIFFQNARIRRSGNNVLPSVIAATENHVTK